MKHINHPTQPVERMTLIFALVLASIILIIAPAGVFFISYQYTSGVLDARAELTAREVTDLVVSNPSMWRFEEVRLSEILERKSKDSVPELKRIIDADGVKIAQYSDFPDPPFIMRQHKIYDAGISIADIQIYRSLKPLLINTFFVTVFALMGGIIIFYFLRKVPLKAIREAYHSLSESEIKYRSLYDTMKEGLALHNLIFDDHGTLISFTIIDANRAFIFIFGDKAEDVIGHDSFELLGESFREHLPGLLGIIGTSDSISFEFSIPNQDSFYMVRSFSPGQNLIATLFEDITEQKKSELQIQKMAYYDSLTGLPNRILFLDRLNNAMARTTRDDTKLAVLFLDLDHFKKVNDTLGHSWGDQLLIKVSERFIKFIRKCDTLARLGGDEFVVVVSELTKEIYAAQVARLLIESLNTLFEIRGQKVHITTSIGIAIFPNDGSSTDTLIKNADMAMYSSKYSGPNGYKFFSSDMNDKAHERMKIEESLRLALEQNEFFLEYQPIINLNNGTISAAEALVRWNNPKLGRIMPNQFISIAEDTGLILPLGEWVLRTACSMIKRLHDSDANPIRISVNLSSRQIERQNFNEVLKEILQDTGAEPSQLEIELTESSLIKYAAYSTTDLVELQKIGVTIAIDDFGTGYSSLSYIRNLPIDHIKIDRSFIKDITTNSNDQAIVEAIIVMSQKLGIRNIAEGVETLEQLNFLREHGCNEIQGYYFYHPLSAEALEDLLKNTGQLKLQNTET
jgi:diguanylate cyclase (GGDEF)-like protein/PAS domain S-box-containing protein